MENKYRGNVEVIKVAEGMEQGQAQCCGNKVQAPACCSVLQATALAVKASFQGGEGCLQVGNSAGCRLCSVECCPRSAESNANSVGGCIQLGRSSIAILLQAAGTPATMVRPRQRLLSRRGSARGGSSRPPATEPHLQCCRCNCHRRAEANPLQASQFMDASSPSSEPDPLPAFGSAIFTFGSSKNKPRINAHISVLFIEETQDGEGGSRNQEEVPDESMEGDEERPAGAPVQASISPQAQQASTSKENTAEDWDSFPTAEEREKYGWCRIVEEKPED